MARNRFARTIGRIASAISGPAREKIENDYLNKATSIYDLERRMQEIDRGKFRNF
ncbi:DUF3563 family protein [Oricola thermophila]|uniref:DUF3563 family protein n=1 Tax=Oricola thermophila TaxID=2742145 RepID=A0A6N1VEY2_9HYPH|nr:DUF3563 family protein [Oricola thermophila]QKV17689.1 DUF3563 family protein [Oricola thermophila]